MLVQSFTVINSDKNNNIKTVTDWVAAQSILTLCMLGNFARFFVVSWFVFKSTFSKKIFQKYHQSVKQFGSKLFVKVISSWQKLPLGGGEWGGGGIHAQSASFGQYNVYM